MATNLAVSRVRSEKRRKDREKRYAEEQRERVECQWCDIYECVDEAIAGLPDKYREAVVLHFIEGKSHAAIAEAMDIPRPKVTYRVGKGVELAARTLRRRGITTAGGALAGLMGANVAGGAAVPALLAASLGKLAIGFAAKQATAGATLGDSGGGGIR